MPPTKEMIDRAVRCLSETNLVHFGTDKASILAGEPVTVSWKVDIPGDCALGVRLNGSSVSREGSRTIKPIRPMAFRLDCGAAGVSKLLGVANVSVDSSNCSQHEIPEGLVRAGALATVDSALAEYNANPDNKDRKVTKRRETVFEIEQDGIVLRLRLKLAVENFFDPNVDVDAKIGVGVNSEGRVTAFYRSFAVDVDWPWWVTGITLGISKIVEEFKDGEVEAKLRSRILESLRSGIQTNADAFDGSLGGLQTIQDAVLVTICKPSGGSLLGHIVNPFERELVVMR